MAAGKKADSIRTRGAPRKDVAARKPGRQARQDRPLTPAQWLFIARYIVRSNATVAYMESHPNATRETALTEGSALLKDPRVASEIAAWVADVKERHLHTAERILETLASQAFTTISDVFDQDGLLIAPHELPRDVAQAVKRIKRTEILTAGKDGEKVLIGHTVELEMKDAFQPLRALGTHYRLFAERVEVGAGEDILRLIREGRERSKATKGAQRDD